MLIFIYNYTININFLVLSKAIISSIFTLISIFLFSQETSYINYTTKDGLPSNETYHIIQDKTGAIWISTDKGVSRYNGYEFENFNTSNGLTDNVVFNIYEDPKGKIWFGTYNAQLCYFYNDSFVKYKYNHLITKRATLMRTLEVDKNETIKITYKDFTAIEIDKFGNLKSYRLFENDTKAKSVQNSLSLLVEIITKINQRAINWDYKKLKDSSDIFVYKNKLYSVENGLLYEKFTCNYELFHVQYINSKWLLNGKNAFQVYTKDFKKTDILIENLESIFISSIEDNQGNIWVTNTKNGIYKIPYNLQGESSLPKGSILEYLWQNYEGNKILSPAKTITSFPSNSLRFYNNQLFHFKNNTSQNFNQKIRSFYYDSKNDDLWMAYVGYIYNVNVKNDSIEKIIPFKDEGIFSIHKDWNDNLLIGTIFGLFKLKEDSLEEMSHLNTVLTKRIQDIKAIGDSALAIATRDNGIFIYTSDTSYIINEDSRLKGNIINQMFVDDEKKLWIATNKGVKSLTFNSDYSVKNLVWEIAKPSSKSSDVLQLFKVKNLLYLTFSNSFEVIDLNRLNSNIESKIPIRIISLSTLDTTITLRNKSILDLNYRQNFVSIKFLAINFNKVEDILYRYQLKGIDNEWISTTSREARYNSLKPGYYEFIVQVRNDKGYWIDSDSIKFNIGQVFWKQWWFVLSASILFITFIFLIFRWLYLNQKKKIQLQNELNSLEQLALSVQMNPHFIFNSLNAIQDYILRNEKIKASDYLGQFSRLIRMTFENNKTPTISLSDEIKTLEQYLKLEKLRFNERFIYTIITDESINTDFCRIPSLLVQPFIENAIWHGILPLEETGKIVIHFLRFKEQLLIEIEDNGIGRNASHKIERTFVMKNQKSSGMEMTKRRLKIINSLQQKSDVVYKEEDLFPSEPNTGTKISFSVPYIEKKI